MKTQVITGNIVTKVVILGTGGTIAGRASRPGDNVGYAAGQIAVADLVAGVPALCAGAFEQEQVAQIDSKDMDFSLWKRLAERVQFHLDRPDVCGLVITHGTDTLEETAWFLHRVLAPRKPVVLTCAMRPASALVPDGPQNLADAVVVAQDSRIQGVVAVCAGQVHAAEHVTKVHTYRTDAFDSGEAGPVGVVEEGTVRLFWRLRPAEPDPVLLERICSADELPWVALVVSHADAQGTVVARLLQDGAVDAPRLRGLVVAGTGNGTIHGRLLNALEQAQAQGVVVWRGTRCARGSVVPGADHYEPLAGPSAVKARISLALELLGRD